MTKKAVAYDEKAIQSLDALEHIRLRTGMYIGRTGDGSHPLDGIYVMVKEVIDNSVDEFIMGTGKRIEVTLEGNTCSVRDFGRGIPLGKVVDCVSEINTGGKFNDDVFQFSVGLNGVGTKAVNALSKQFRVISYRDGKYKRASFKKGRLKEEKGGRDSKSPSGTLVEFEPDPEIFKNYEWNLEFIDRRMRYYSFLNSGLTLVLNSTRYLSRKGLEDLLVYEMGETSGGLYEIAYCKSDKIEFAFTHTTNYGENYFSFVNGQYTNDGGTHQSAFREGLLKGINEFAGKNFSGEDVREGMIGAVAIKLQEPIFESQTKNRLGSSEVRSWMVPLVKEKVLMWLHSHDGHAKNLLEKVKQNERIR